MFVYVKKILQKIISYNNHCIFSIQRIKERDIQIQTKYKQIWSDRLNMSVKLLISYTNYIILQIQNKNLPEPYERGIQQNNTTAKLPQCTDLPLNLTNIPINELNQLS